MMAWVCVVLLAIFGCWSAQGGNDEGSIDNHTFTDLNGTVLTQTGTVSSVLNVTQVNEIFLPTTSTTTAQPTTRFIPKFHVMKLSSIVMDLGIKLHKILRRQYPKKNFVFSPFCLATGLSMAYAGASGATKEQIGQLLGLAEGPTAMTESDLHHTFSYVHRVLTTGLGNSSVNLANAFFSSEGINFKESFSNLVKNLYKGETFSLDFGDGESERSLRYINEWISNKTDNLIANALQPGNIHPPVLLLLLSVVHFQGAWTFPFELKNTKLKQFYLAPNIGKNMYMMHKKQQRLYYGDVPLLKSKILEIPFEGDALSFYVILPNTITGLPEAEAQFTSGIIWRNLGRMVRVDVELTLPRFKLETKLQMHSSIGALGSELMLSPSLAELTGIADGANLFLSGMTQNSVFEVTEKGVEAASLIGQQIALSAINNVYQVTVDHPFLFFIMDKRTKVTLYMGRIVFPPEGSDSLVDLAMLHLMDMSRASNSNFSPLWIVLYLMHICISR